jgi:catechol 2,3-dioxygenase
MNDEVTTSDESTYGVAPAAYRLPSATCLGPVRLQVADLDRSRGFYRDVLGLEARGAGDGRADLAPAAGGPTLVQLVERQGAAPVPRRGRLGLFHYAILLPDRADLGRFLAHASAAGVPPGAADHRVSEALYLHDPDGLGIEVYADRPRSAWRHVARQLVMATDPLDLRDLARAGGGEPWAGMPAGAVIGHVHLHVGDLPEADRFYHQGLGLDRVVWSYPGALFLSAGGYHHHLGVNTWAAGADPAGEDDARLLEWEVVVPAASDARAALENMAAAGYPVESDGAGGVARDPWGTAVRVRAGSAAGSA